MGFALRCEGGYVDQSQEDNFASDRLTLASGQQDLALKLAAGQPDTDQDVKEQKELAEENLAKAYTCFKDATCLANHSSPLIADQSRLVRLKKELEEAVSTMDRVVKMEMSERQRQEALTQQKTGEALADVLHEVTATASRLQREVLKLEKKIKDTAEADYNHNEKVEDLVQALKNLRTSQQKLAFDQQALAKQQEKSGLMRTALEHSGPTLVSALVIGFDMESEGLPSALARIFRRVSGASVSDACVELYRMLECCLSTLGVHAQPGLQYLVCVCVCLSVPANLQPKATM